MSRMQFLFLMMGSLAWAHAQGKSVPMAPPFFTDQAKDFVFHSFEDDHGGFYLIWTDNQDEGAAHLKAQHIVNGQAQWKNDVVLITNRLSSLRDWEALADGQGGITLFWNEQDGVYAQRVNPDGSRRLSGQGGGVRLSTSTAILPQAVPDASGGTLVIWGEDALRGGGGRTVLVAQRFKNGKPLWGEQSIRVSRRPSQQTNPQVVYDNASGVIVGWRDEMNEASEMRVQRLDSGGTRLWGEEGLSVYTPMGVNEMPVMIPGGAGDTIVTWAEFVGGYKHIALERVGPGPQFNWNKISNVSSIPNVNRWNPMLFSDGKTGTWVAWEDYRNQQNTRVQLNHLNAQGESVWPSEVTVAPVDSDQGRIGMTDDGYGGVWMAWVDNREATVGVYAQHINGQGPSLSWEKGLKIRSNLHNPTQPQLIPLGNGNAAVVFADRASKMDWNLYWYNLSTHAPPKS